MPFPRPHLLVTAIGDAWAGQEEWAFGMRVDRTALPSPAEMATIVTAVTTFYQSPGAKVSQFARLTAVKVAPIGVDGRYPVGADAVETILAPPVVGLSSQNAQPQSTLAVSLGTALSRGRGSKGRFYPPAFTAYTESDGRITTPNAAAMRDAAVTLLADLQATLLAPVVVGSSLGAGSLRPVTSVRVGRVVDTQRRRRRGIIEAYVEAPLPPP